MAVIVVDKGQGFRSPAVQARSILFQFMSEGFFQGIDVQWHE